MKVRASDESHVRTAGRLLNDRINHYQQKFGLQDPQDLLAMVAFDCLIETLKTEKLGSRLVSLIEQITKALDESDRA